MGNEEIAKSITNKIWLGEDQAESLFKPIKEALDEKDFHLKRSQETKNRKIKELETKLEKAKSGLSNLVNAIEKCGYFNSWEPERDSDVVVDGEIDKDVWWEAKETLNSLESLSEESK